jgi:hypothetical protein
MSDKMKNLIRAQLLRNPDLSEERLQVVLSGEGYELALPTINRIKSDFLSVLKFLDSRCVLNERAMEDFRKGRLDLLGLPWSRAARPAPKARREEGPRRRRSYSPQEWPG